MGKEEELIFSGEFLRVKKNGKVGRATKRWNNNIIGIGYGGKILNCGTLVSKEELLKEQTNG